MCGVGLALRRGIQTGQADGNGINGHEISFCPSPFSSAIEHPPLSGRIESQLDDSIHFSLKRGK
jgi:hypothetical protein